MMIARWRIDARFGHKQQVIDSIKWWNKEVGAKIGWSADKVRVLTGSVGAAESAVEVELQVADLAALSAAWDKLAKIEAHNKWSRELEPHVVSGSHHWQVFRVVD